MTEAFMPLAILPALGACGSPPPAVHARLPSDAAGGRTAVPRFASLPGLPLTDHAAVAAAAALRRTGGAPRGRV